MGRQLFASNFFKHFTLSGRLSNYNGFVDRTFATSMAQRFRHGSVAAITRGLVGGNF